MRTDRLYHLLQAGNQDATIKECHRFLEQDPNSLDAHFCLALAYIDSEQLKKAKQHVDYLMANDPEGSSSMLAGTVWQLAQKNYRKVRKLAAEGMRVDPDNYIFYYYAAVAEAGLMRFKEAKRFVQSALALNPEDVDSLNLQVRLSAIGYASAESAWRRIEELQSGLRLDPENAALHNSLGDVYLDELDCPKEAEHHYRQALVANPRDKVYQRDLFNAVAQRNLIYRTLNIPSRMFSNLRDLLTAIAHQPWRLLFLIAAFKFVIGFFVWLFLVTVLFWPAGKVYEWLLISEIKSGANSSTGKLKLWMMFQRIPLWFRLGLFLAINCGIYAGMFSLLGVPLSSGFTFVAITAALHFALIVFFWLFKRMRRQFGKGRRERKKRKQPPPLPVA